MAIALLMVALFSGRAPAAKPHATQAAAQPEMMMLPAPGAPAMALFGAPVRALPSSAPVVMAPVLVTPPQSAALAKKGAHSPTVKELLAGKGQKAAARPAKKKRRRK
jgi:hypothetical protein